MKNCSSLLSPCLSSSTVGRQTVAVWWCLTVWCAQTDCRGTAGAVVVVDVVVVVVVVVAVSSLREVTWNFVSASVQTVCYCIALSYCRKAVFCCSGFCVTFYIVLVFCSDLLECFWFYMVQLFCCLTVLWERGDWDFIKWRVIAQLLLLLLSCHMLQITLFSLHSIYVTEITRYWICR